MYQDRQRTKQFTDEELALRRHARFGKLPVPVTPDDLIETEATDRPDDGPQEPFSVGSGDRADSARGGNADSARSDNEPRSAPATERSRWYRYDRRCPFGLVSGRPAVKH